MIVWGWMSMVRKYYMWVFMMMWLDFYEDFLIILLLINFCLEVFGDIRLGCFDCDIRLR